jgi:hypothetical protein
MVKNTSVEKPENISINSSSQKFRADLYQTLLERKTTRQYKKEKISEDSLAKILWAAIGVNRKGSGRTAPMPFGDVIIDLYITSEKGTYRYNGESNLLEGFSNEDIRGKVANQEFVGGAPYVIIMTVDLSKCPDSWEKEDLIRWSHATAGTIAQNIYLATAALNLGTVMIGWIDSDEIKKRLMLKSPEIPLYVIPIGKRKD